MSGRNHGSVGGCGSGGLAASVADVGLGMVAVAERAGVGAFGPVG